MLVKANKLTRVQIEPHLQIVLIVLQVLTLTLANIDADTSNPRGVYYKPKSKYLGDFICWYVPSFRSYTCTYKG